jgi:hypothetical protein
MNKNEEQIKKDSEILAEFVHLYCSGRHPGAAKAPAAAGGAVGAILAPMDFTYCDECRRLILHAVSKRVLCPYDPKPTCKKCPVHCYGPGYREKIREVMRYSGMRLIRKGRLRLIKKYFS